MERPSGITIISIILFFGGIIRFLTVPGILISLAFQGVNVSVIAFTILYTALAILAFVAGYGVLKMKRWGFSWQLV
jgi:prepilin signal peptidase PulO-like enzyme (type II secretory pathway)